MWRHHRHAQTGVRHEIPGPDGTVSVIITTHPNKQDKITAALKGLADLKAVCDKPVCIRIVDIPEDKE